MNFLAYKIAEHFGRELLKTAALVAVSTLAAEVGMKIAERLTSTPEDPVVDDGQTLDLSAFLPQGQEDKKHVIKVDNHIVINSYNEDNDNSKRRKEEGCVHGAQMVQDGPCDGCEEGCPECEE